MNKFRQDGQYHSVDNKLGINRLITRLGTQKTQDKRPI